MLLEDGQKEFKSAELNSKAENVHHAKYRFFMDIQYLEPMTSYTKLLPR